VTDFFVTPIKVHILEMEDVLFHLDSAVMMPDAPAGKSSTQGTTDDPEDAAIQAQENQLSGVRALAVTFKQFEFDSRKRLLVAGHTDTSGAAQMNFELSDQRASAIVHLLEGNRDEWADISFHRHHIEDYQQIMKYVSVSPRFGWNTDPIKLDNKWGDDTSTATKNFITSYNTWILSGLAPTEATQIPESLHTQIKNDSQHKWPVEMWQAIYDIYNEEMAAALKVSREVLASKYRGMLQFCDTSKKYVACGESFPIDHAERENYRSQLNRRVELLFFDQDEVPVLNCPARTSTVHTEEECPLWHKLHFTPIYIDPTDLTAIAYHLKFVYFDRVYQALKEVPEGLTIKAFENGSTELPAKVSYSNGVYMVKVQDDSVRTDIHFTFATTDQWIFSADSSTAPTLVTKTATEIAAMPFTERIKYNDLPPEWSAKNYWTRFDGSMANGDRFKAVLQTRKTLKPFGGNTTASGQPLTFSLDDIVLGDTNRSQLLVDQNSTGASIPLDNNSRYSLMFLDYATMETIAGTSKNMRRMKIHNPEPAQPCFTNVQFNTNLITDVPGNTRVVYFCNGFYDVYDKRSRSTDPGFGSATNPVVGARLALKNDADVHASYGVNAATQPSDLTNAYALFPGNAIIGHYQLHYIHNAGDLDGKPLMNLLVHWNCRFTRVTSDPLFGTAVPAATAADIANHRIGVGNAMARHNKNYMIEKSSGTADIFIRPFFFMEAKIDTNGGRHIALVNVVGNSPDPGAWMMPNNGQLRQRDFKSDPTYFGNADPDNSLQDTDGSTYTVLTNAHEMGHACGNADEYLYDMSDNASPPNTWRGLPKYNQPNTAEGGPYSCDKLALMLTNRTFRLRHIWKYVCWLHDQSATGGILNKFFNGTRFKISFQATGFVHNYELKDIYKNVQIAPKADRNHATSPNSQADLLLYKLGDEELGRMLKSGQIINGILVVKTKFALRFDNGPTAWTLANKQLWAQQLFNNYQAMCNLKFRLSTAATNDFSNTYVHFVPHFTVYTAGFLSSGAPSDSHINVEITSRNGGRFSASGKTLAVDQDTSQNRIIRYCFGLTAGAGNLNKNNFGTIVTWISSASGAGATFAMNDL
jgi:hypothetical protein